MSKDRWTNTCINLAIFMIGIFVLGFIISTCWIILNIKDPIVPFPSLGPFKVPRHLFLVFACGFALYIAIKLHHWLLDYKESLRSLPIVVMICWAGSELLLFFSCLLPYWWLLVIAFLMIARMIMDSWCRFSIVKTTIQQWNIWGILGAACYCVIVSAIMGYGTWRFVDDAKLFDYIAILLPIVLLIIPRILTDSEAAREVYGFADYAWYPAITVFVIVTTAAHIGFEKLVIIIVANKEQAQMDTLMCDLQSLFVILYLIGLIGCFKVFPRAIAAKKKGSD